MSEIDGLTVSRVKKRRVSSDASGDLPMDSECVVVKGLSTPPKLPSYEMGRAKKGKCIVFPMTTFLSPRLRPREGCEKDVEHVIKVFGERGFQVKVYPNYRRKQVLQVLEEASKEDHASADCFVVVFMSHGNKGILHAYDESFERSKLWEPFTADKCATLTGKPKIFFIQACRGNDFDLGKIVAKTHNPSTAMQADVIPDQKDTTPNQADFLIVSATPEGYISCRNEKNGSIFIQKLCNVLQEERHTNKHLLQMMTTLNHRLSVRNPNDLMSVYDQDGNYLNDVTQTPEVYTTLTKVLYF